ncbi:L-threonylcarbamoyladenylate synthase [Patescibacteria group bacterium]
MAEIINFQSENIDKIVQKFQAGLIVAFPTDTVYGVGVSLNNRDVIKRFYDLKSRPSDKPSQILISDNEMLYKYVDQVSMQTELLIERYWPGALTLVFNATSDVPPRILQDNSVGVRMPNYPLLQEVIAKLGCPIVTASANFAGEEAPTSFESLNPDFVKDIDVIVSGPILLNQESSVVDVREAEIKMLREGVIKASDIKQTGIIT